MSPTLLPAAPPAQPETVGAPLDGAATPPNAEFATLLEAAALEASGEGPPGETKPSTRTADAGGDQAGSDSSEPVQKDQEVTDPSALAAAMLTAVPVPPPAEIRTTATVAVDPATMMSPASGSTGARTNIDPAVMPHDLGQAGVLDAPESDAIPGSTVSQAAAVASTLNGSPVAVASGSATAPTAPEPAVPAQTDTAQATLPTEQTGTGTLSGSAAPAAAPTTQAASAGQVPQAPTSPDPSGSTSAPGALNSTESEIAIVPSGTVAAQDAALAAQGDTLSERPTTSQPSPTLPESQDTATPDTSVTLQSSGDDTRRSRGETGDAEQPARLATPADQNPAPVSTAGDILTHPSDTSAKTAAAPPAQQPSPQTPVRLTELAEAAQTAITVAAGSRSGSARISMHPVELGSVQIQLHYRADGVFASIRAESPEAAQLLQHAAPDLRRALEGQGLTLLNLDIRDESGAASDSNQAGHRHHGAGGRARHGEPESERAADTAIDHITSLVPGSQIDVLA